MVFLDWIQLLAKTLHRWFRQEVRPKVRFHKFLIREI